MPNKIKKTIYYDKQLFGELGFCFYQSTRRFNYAVGKLEPDTGRAGLSEREEINIFVS